MLTTGNVQILAELFAQKAAHAEAEEKAAPDRWAAREEKDASAFDQRIHIATAHRDEGQWDGKASAWNEARALLLQAAGLDAEEAE